MKKKHSSSNVTKIGVAILIACIGLVAFQAITKSNKITNLLNNSSSDEITVTPDPSTVLSAKNRKRVTRPTPKPTTAITVKPTLTIKPTVIVTSTPIPTTTSIVSSGIQTEAWIYPGPPACNSVNELKTRGLHTVKVEYLSLGENGKLSTMTEALYGCNGYSTANMALIKQYAQEVYVTIAGSKIGMTTMASNSTLRDGFVQQARVFVNNNSLSGVDIDFEEYSQWNQTDYANFKNFITVLGNELHKTGKKLQIDFPPIGSAEMQQNYLLKYEDFNLLPVDQYTIMAYDYQYDYGAGVPVQPVGWLNAVIDWSKSKFINTSKISIGTPAYGYKGLCKDYSISILTYTQLSAMPGFSTAVRDPESQEMMWRNNGNCYTYSDSTTLNRKLEVIKSKGITKVSIWHLGGNLWFGN